MSARFDNAVPAEERLFCLLLALLPGKRGMSKADIFETVRGYREEFLTDGPSDSLNKKFERDKDELKSMGIPLVTSETENPADAVYSVSQGEYEQFAFSEAEVSLLTAATAVWSESAHAAEANDARLRLLAADAGTDPYPLNDLMRIDTRDAAHPAIASAVTAHTVISFPYLKPGELKAHLRTVSPQALVNYDGRWHLLAWDHEREAERTFLLRRIVGKVHTLSRPQFHATEPGAADKLIAHLDALWNTQEAVLVVQPDTKAAVSLSNRRGTVVTGTEYRVHYLDTDVFAEELSEYGAEALVLSPLELREAVITKLTQLVADHG